ncbi:MULTISPECIES: tRNA lysidine(34) synthetase TilS [Thiorhodovibrio]|uniref:tRNA lysidine(34) synthetase TilS n=1 Tax=Thiorhodovibrio TaxID=61593 RepID=UPI0019113F03|nr:MULTISPECIES: tRNA lysidine(34) synthetase TilS [Thiorhodovibrio]MBK5968053.1 tRNA lysidine(34) synthetase TilS [Thiorhodovibrio winogradskyi]
MAPGGPWAANGEAPNLLPDALRLSLVRQPAAQVWIALSGGRDSSALLHAAVQAIEGLATANRPALSAIHIDHGLHADSSAWAAHCRACCAALGVPLQVRLVDAAARPGQSPEEAARAARWSVWEPLLAPGEQLWLAQHQDDQAETLLLALLRGAGVTGLAGIARIRALGAGLAVRPWLDVTGAQIATYARAQRLHWIEDPSNQDSAFDRNYLRHRVLPLLRSRWPAASATMARAADHCAEAEGLIATASAGWLAEVRGQMPDTLSVSALRALPPEQCRAVLRHWLAQHGFRLPSRRRLEQVSRSLLAARADASPLVAWSGCELRRYRDDLFALEPLPLPRVDALPWDARQPQVLGGRLGELSLPALGAASRRELGQLDVRFGVTGISCRPRPDGPRRRLKALFQQQGVPAWLRPYVPLIFAGEQLLAVAGVMLCDTRLVGLRWRHALGVNAGLTEILEDSSRVAKDAALDPPVAD